MTRAETFIRLLLRRPFWAAVNVSTPYAHLMTPRSAAFPSPRAFLPPKGRSHTNSSAALPPRGGSYKLQAGRSLGGSCQAQEPLAPSAGSRASTFATMRSQRAPANANTSPVARSISRASASRSSARALKRRVRTVAGEIDRHSAISSMLMSSTSRMTKTVRNELGSSSIRRSRMRRGLGTDRTG